MSILPKSLTRRWSALFPRVANIAALGVIAALSVTLFLTSNAQAAQVTLTWDDPNNTPTRIRGYNLYYWQPTWEVPTSVDVGKRLTYTIPDLEVGQTYHFAVTAYNASGDESAFSNEASAAIPDGEPDPDPTPGTVVFAVNAGGPRYVDTAGTVYQADTRFSGGATYTKTTAINGTTDDVLYQSERYGDFSYAIPLPDGDYEVRLKFAELYWSAVGKRIFDVAIEGTEVLSNLDLVAKVGPAVVYDVVIPVRVTDGALNILFHTDVDNAKVSAIKVTTRGDTSPPANSAPVAGADTATTREGTGVTIAVLANDTDADGDALSLTAVTQGANGTVAIAGPAALYTPRANFRGTDTFRYTVRDSQGGTATGTVKVTITPVNDPPVALHGTLTTKKDTVASGILRARDVDRDTLTYSLVTNGSKGTVRLTSAATGAYIYTPHAKVTGTGTFTFQVTDGTTNSNIARVKVTISPADAGQVVFAVNAGGPAYVGTDGTVYQADTGFSGGQTYTRAVAIAGTEDDILYQSGRYGDFAYAIPVPNGDYVVTLKFAELYWTVPDKRAFAVEIEGLEVLRDLDLVAQVGPATTYDVTMPVLVTDGVLDIHFFTGVDNAKVSAIVVETQARTP